jgi:hypothetical protein
VAANQWFIMEMLVQGNYIVVKLNGKTTVNYTAPPPL